jgi:hypothetical protein
MDIGWMKQKAEDAGLLVSKPHCRHLQLQIKSLSLINTRDLLYLLKKELMAIIDLQNQK